MLQPSLVSSDSNSPAPTQPTQNVTDVPSVGDLLLWSRIKTKKNGTPTELSVVKLKNPPQIDLTKINSVAKNSVTVENIQNGIEIVVNYQDCYIWDAQTDVIRDVSCQLYCLLPNESGLYSNIYYKCKVTEKNEQTIIVSCKNTAYTLPHFITTCGKQIPACVSISKAFSEQSILAFNLDSRSSTNSKIPRFLLSPIYFIREGLKVNVYNNNSGSRPLKGTVVSTTKFKHPESICARGSIARPQSSLKCEIFYKKNNGTPAVETFYLLDGNSESAQGLYGPSMIRLEEGTTDDITNRKTEIEKKNIDPSPSHVISAMNSGDKVEYMCLH